MNTTDPDITFDAEGICNHCRAWEGLARERSESEASMEFHLQETVRKIRHEGISKEYDCLLGLSGGVDSSFVAYLAGRMGLRPLVVHLDNGWNSELAVENIRQIVERLNFDLYTHVINWEEFCDLQRSFFKASVIDIEILSDHAITAALFNIAREQGIRYILSGSNFATEFGMPKSWVWRKQDLVNIRGIQKRFGTCRIRSFPTFNTWQRGVNALLKRVRYIRLLDLISYRKEEAMEKLTAELGWRYYGGKHYESIFTKFYQAYVLPEKFGIDKRRAHLSALIRNSEMSRAEGLEALGSPPYDSSEMLTDREYVLKKLEFSEAEFDEIMARPVKAHTDYPTDEIVLRHLGFFIRLYQRMFEY